MDYKSIYILDNDTKFLFDKDRKKHKVISSESELNTLLSDKFSAENVIILVELNWYNTISTFYGYEVAKQLMASSNRTGKFNLLFISTFSRETLYKIYKNSNNVFIKKFNHAKIDADFNLFNLSIPEYSEKKFNYIKNYCLISAGIIDRLIHDVRNIRNSFNDERYKSLIGDLYANSDILSSELVSSIDQLSDCGDVDKRNTLLDGFLALLHRHQREISNPDESYPEKSRARLLLVEDNKDTLDKLVHTFSYYFSSIKQCGSGSDAVAMLKAEGKQIDVVLTDMELLVGNFDDEKQGIDILELCADEYPHIVTRVVTALPKNAVKQLIGMLEGNILYKGGEGSEVIYPTENLNEFVEKIDEEIVKRKILRNIQGPSGDNWWGKYLVGKLYDTKYNDLEKYTKIWNTAKKTADKFINNEFNDLENNDKLAATFVKTTNHEGGWRCIELLLTHRLIVLWYSCKANKPDFYYRRSEGYNSYVRLSGFHSDMLTKPSKNYLSSLLGFNQSGAKGHVVQEISCSIKHKNLFPEEISWLEETFSVNSTYWNSDSLILCEINSDFSDWFIDTYKVDKHTTKIIDEDNITLGKAKEHFDVIKKHFSIINSLNNNPILIKKFKLDYSNWYSDELHSELKEFTEEIMTILNL